MKAVLDLTKISTRATVIFDEPVRAITPFGQAVVFLMTAKSALAGGIIDTSVYERVVERRLRINKAKKGDS